VEEEEEEERSEPLEGSVCVWHCGGRGAYVYTDGETHSGGRQ
jgi:hypothetical protein